MCVKIDYFCICLNFQVKCPEDYRQWLVSMYSLFGTKWVKLHCGPMWRVESTAQEDGRAEVTQFDPTEVQVANYCMFTEKMYIEIRVGTVLVAAIMTILQLLHIG